MVAPALRFDYGLVRRWWRPVGDGSWLTRGAYSSGSPNGEVAPGIVSCDTAKGPPACSHAYEKGREFSPGYAPNRIRRQCQEHPPRKSIPSSMALKAAMLISPLIRARITPSRPTK